MGRRAGRGRAVAPDRVDRIAVHGDHRQAGFSVAGDAFLADQHRVVADPSLIWCVVRRAR